MERRKDSTYGKETGCGEEKIYGEEAGLGKTVAMRARKRVLNGNRMASGKQEGKTTYTTQR